MFYLSRSLSTDRDFWNSAGLEAFISQQWRIHPADVGGKHAYIPFLILSGTHGDTHAFRINCHLQFQKRRFWELLCLTIKQSCHWDKGIKSPLVALPLSGTVALCCRSFQSCAATPKKSSSGQRFKSQVIFYFYKQRWGKGHMAIYLLFLEGVIII